MKFVFKFLQQFCDFAQKYCVQIGCTLLILYCLWPTRFASHYEYIASDQIFDSLLQKTTRNVTLSQEMECDYSDIIKDNTFMYKQSYQNDIFDSSEIKLGGVYHPGNFCTTLFNFNFTLLFTLATDDCYLSLSCLILNMHHLLEHTPNVQILSTSILTSNHLFVHSRAM